MDSSIIKIQRWRNRFEKSGIKGMDKKTRKITTLHSAFVYQEVKEEEN